MQQNMPQKKKTPPKAFYAEGGAFFFNFVNSYLLLSVFPVQRMESRSGAPAIKPVPQRNLPIRASEIATR